MFLPPEAFNSAVSMEEGEMGDDLASASAWDVATRYHEFKSKPAFKKIARHLRRLSAHAILERACEVMGSVVHPTTQMLSPWSDLPASAEQIEIDLDETLENSPLGVMSASDEHSFDYPLTAEEVWMSYNVHRRQPVVLSVDTSLSMTGEKLALTAVALAVVLLQFPEDPVGIIAFENEAKILKLPEEKISLQELIERFLDVPAQGYTHLEDGMKAALKLVRNSSSMQRPTSAVLLTDGKYTAGRDPSYLAASFPHLVVLKMGRERASEALCLELAQKGHGVLKEVGDLEILPNVMYSLVKDLLRGRSV